MEYRKEIDGLRAVAVLPVILFHAGFSWFSGGYIGVDVFFVISGYLITSILIKDLENGRFSIAQFYERRARRILPALFFVMMCCIPFAYTWMIPQQFKDFSQAFVAVSFFSSNILFWAKEDYFAPAAELNPLLHTWSLAVEEQFYIFFPLLLLVLWRFGKRPIFYVVLGLSCASLLLSEWGWRNSPSANFYLLPTRAWELGAGAMCALYNYHRPIKANKTLSTLGFCLILYSIFLFDESIPFPSAYTLVPVVGTALIILFCSTGTLVYNLLSLKFVVGIGLISYSAYLWHQPLMAFARIEIFPYPHWTTMLALCFSSLALAYLTWRYVERPFRTKNGSWINSRAKVFATAFVASCAVFSFGFYGHINNGIPDRIRLSAEQSAYLSTATSSPMRNKCHASADNPIKPQNACRYNNDNATIAVFGDSHVVELAYALGEQVKGTDIGVAHFSFSGCAASYGNRDSSACSEWANNTVSYLIDSDEFTHIIVSYRMAAQIWGTPLGAYPNLPTIRSEDKANPVIESLRNTLEDIAASGKQVIYVDQSPELPRSIQELVYADRIINGDVQGLSRDWWDAFNTFFNNKDIVPKFVERINVDKILCDDEVCYAGKEGVSFYFDEDHLSVEGAKRIADLILSETDILLER
ncbi:acyltransferase family protein [Vreelandella neptunia]|uniref:Acyltransferase n=1 Tax=Vreelandella neptunia TaxID=115551 RepID=A0ABS9S3V0_9GAMM|nr:acyltransferase family protein [Halomonas neptunia]MCH4810779.1 acyltransferase [Halomonas neptunia]